jgi:hypothetical protein
MALYARHEGGHSRSEASAAITKKARLVVGAVMYYVC